MQLNADSVLYVWMAREGVELSGYCGGESSERTQFFSHFRNQSRKQSRSNLESNLESTLENTLESTQESTLSRENLFRELWSTQSAPTTQEMHLGHE